jgi:glucose-6-phosphate isomerase
MSTPLQSLDIWQQLKHHFSDIQQQHMLDWFNQDSNRFDRFKLEAAGISLDYSKNRIQPETMDLLTQLAVKREIPAQIKALFDGELVNKSEQRPALHTALRNFSDRPVMVDGVDIMPEIRDTMSRMEQFCWKVRRKHWRGYTNKAFTDVVSIGIGGSFLGPKLASSALKPYNDNQINVHYLANIDGSHITEILKHLNPETTLFIVQSKSFSTQETLKNATACRRWFLDNGGTESELHKHFAAVSANVEKAVDFGISKENIFPMWDWVGGRYSLWSAIGLPLALAIGIDNFRDMLRGAHDMDEHFRTAPMEKNMPVIMALLGVWYINFFDITSHAILPYDHYLRGLPAHLQQLDMESNGKSIGLDGRKVDYHTGPIIWGGVGSNGQHAYHQLLHQGTHFSPSDFIVPMRSHNPIDNFHALLVSNALSQSQALLTGKTEQQAIEECLAKGMNESEAVELAAQKIIPGNRPSNTIYFPKSTPHSVGALIALYEHKIAVQGMIWGVNSFDQWGVELGKEMGNLVLAALENRADGDSLDCSTSNLVQAYKDMQELL